MAPQCSEKTTGGRRSPPSGKSRSKRVLPNVPSAFEAGFAGYEAQIWLD